MLCSNRVPIPVLPATCTLDAVIVPLPSFFLFAAVGLVINGGSTQATRIIPIRWLHIVYMFCVVAACGMSILELTRLAIAERGVGLLPATPVAMAFIFAFLWHERKARRRALCIAFLSYWGTLIAFQALKTSRLFVLNTVSSGRDTRFPTMDQITDNLVMVGLFSLCFIFEVVEIVRACLFKSHSGSNVPKDWEMT
ncbi:hypothetical protein ONZ45_g1281 [Pleurotus djamor]|nr:hypothetical protein ONZ45_g1281 [Pleurotus djamor]